MAKKSILLAGAFLGSACGASLFAQVREVPFGQPRIEPSSGPTLHEAIRFSQIFQDMQQTGEVSTSTISGELDYASGSVRRPLELLYSGGGSFTTDPMGNTIYQNLQFSQGFAARSWNLTLGNTFSYLPQSPAGGLSGIPGVGDLTGSGGGVIPPGVVPNQSILATNAARYSEAVFGDLERRINGNTSLEGSGAFGLLRFPGDKGINSDQEAATVGINRRLNPLNILSMDFRYARFQFSGTGFAFQSPSLALDYKRTWSRVLASDVSFGPEWVRSSNPAVVPNRLLLAGTATLSFERGQNSAVVGYTRGTSGGSGALGGAEVDTVQAGFSRNLQREWRLAATLSWARTAGLQTGTQSSAAATPGSTGSLILPVQSKVNAEYGGLQLTRSLGRHLSAYLSYTALHQTISNPGPSTPTANGTNGQPLLGLSNVVGFGFSYTPRDRRIRRQ